jgi:predicted Zn finger-like uncharacterized protein
MRASLSVRASLGVKDIPVYARRRQRGASMIVICSSCQTRFRVPRDKVGPNGARIRCSRCQTVFAIVPEVQLAPAPPPPPQPTRAAPPPLPSAARRAAARATVSPPPVPPDDPFAPRPAGGAPMPGARFAAPSHDPAAAPLGSDPFAAALGQAPGSALRPVPDPFAPEPAAPSPPGDPFGVDLGPDPFGVAGDDPVSRNPAAAGQRATPDLGQLLGGPDARVDPSALALEEHDPAPPARPRFDADGGPLAFEGHGDPLNGPGSEGPTDVIDVPRTAAEVPSAAGLGSPPPPSSREPPRERPPSSLAGTSPGHEDTPSEATPARAGRLASVVSSSLSLALLIVVAAALFVAWRSGLGVRLEGVLAHASPGTPPPLVEAAGVTGGLYDTSAGAPVLVVRGHVVARTRVAGPVRVRVDVVAAGRTVATAEGLAGASATPEEVFGAGADEPAAALRHALDGRATPRLEAGASAPFLVLFPPPAPEPRFAELRVSAEPVSGGAR